MVIILFGVVACWSLLVIKMINQIKILKSEVAFLPPERQTNRYRTDSSGVNLTHHIVIPKNRTNQPAIVLAASPTCGVCHDMLEELLQTLPSLHIPYFALVDASVENHFHRFFQDYAKYIEMVPIDIEQQRLLGIEAYPVLLIVDEEGIIRKRTHLLRAAITIYNESFRKLTGAAVS